MGVRILEAAQYVGKVARWRANVGHAAVVVPVTVTDLKHAFGFVKFEIEPVGGEGRLWVNSDSLSFKAKGGEHDPF